MKNIVGIIKVGFIGLILVIIINSILFLTKIFLYGPEKATIIFLDNLKDSVTIFIIVYILIAFISQFLEFFLESISSAKK